MLLIGAGWLGTNLGYSIADLPLRFLLKDQLHLQATGVAAFFAIAHFTNYIKPLAGILTVHSNAAFPSSIVLPVVPASALN